jgi:tRNA(Ile)-lysidine synthase
VSPFVEAMWRSLEGLVAPASPRSTGIVAVSGGPDSVALVRGLHAMAPEALVVAHFNHRLRGAEGEEDVRFVRELAESLGLRFRTGSAEVREVAQATGANVEDTARQLRYRWLTETAGDVGAIWVATGHTADDQAETMLHRLIRGAGLQGLRGIAPRRELSPGVVVVRPLLGLSRGDVLSYLEEIGQPFRTDSTNADTRLTRNRIRHELLPLLRTYNPAIGDILARLAEQATAMCAEQEALARELLRHTELPRAGPICVFDRARLAQAPRHRVRDLFRLVWQREGWSLGGMSFEHWERLASVASGEGTAIDLPGRVHARVREGVVQVGPVRSGKT